MQDHTHTHTHKLTNKTKQQQQTNERTNKQNMRIVETHCYARKQPVYKLKVKNRQIFTEVFQQPDSETVFK